MLVVVSPAKKLDFETETPQIEPTTPFLFDKTKVLSKELKKLKKNDIKKLMKLSDNLSELNFNRFQTLNTKGSTQRPAVFAFNGDTYTGLDISSFKKSELNMAQKKLRILSGLYGVLKPFDEIEAYRLEMGTKFSFKEYKNLYNFWASDVTDYFNSEEKKEKFIINCASNEYFKVIDTKKLNAKVITPIFKENRDGKLKIISFSAKKARGMMANYIIKNNLTDPSELKSFNSDGYKFSKELSSDSEIVFVR